MTSNLVTPTQEERTQPAVTSGVETAPSILRTDELGLPRSFGLLGGFLVLVGGGLLLLNLMGSTTRINVGTATLGLVIGLAALLYHAAFESDLQLRRIYMAGGLLALLVGAVLCLLPYPQSVGDQFGSGFLFLSLALLYLIAFLRNENDPLVRHLVQLALLGAGSLMALIALVGGNIRGDFLPPYGVLLGVLGLVYLTTFVATRGVSDDRAYFVSWLLRVVGGVVFLVALARTAWPILAGTFHWAEIRPAGYLVPYGLLLMILGAAYAVVSVGLSSDRPFVVLTRRELSGFFLSPIAYFVLFAFTIAAWWCFLEFIDGLAPDPVRGQSVAVEPIVARFFLQWPVVICTLFIVPALTMRLLSEEKQTGTLEVLLTAPVEESTVVLSKFLAAFLLFLVMWLPFGLFLIALRVGNPKDYDYRPLLSFAVGLGVTGANFISMGVFFSSLTRNQIASAVLTFGGMLALTMVFLFKLVLSSGQFGSPSNALMVVLNHVSYLDVWINNLSGKLVLQTLVFPASMTILWLFLTVRILEARRWV